jgi:hypothetical protein
MLNIGLHDVPEDAYHADRTAVSKSWLDYIERSPAHLKAYLDGLTHRDSEELDIGRLAHCLILEEDRFLKQFVCAPKIDKRTTAGKQQWAEFEAANKGRMLVTQDHYKLVFNIRDAVMKHSKAAALLRNGEPEKTIVWKDANTGELCKARADWLRQNAIVDIKTTRDARPSEFAKAIANYRYHVQAAHYEAGFNLNRFIFIAVEKDPPFGVAVYFADSEMVKSGTEARARNLGQYAECKASGNWPCYSESITTIQLPRWAA